jgi:UDP-N-acetylmuramate--alanine ligase
LNLNPIMSVVTNIDADHMDTYGHDFNKLKGAFIEFLHRMPFYGAAVLCVDDPVLHGIFADVSRPITSYGLSEQAQVRAMDVKAVGSRMQFMVTRSNGITLPPMQIDLNLPGLHNVRNALAAIAVAVELNVPDEAVVQALADFKGVGRRFQNHGEQAAAGGGRYTLIEDYGHHPVELAATIEAARGAYPGRRLVLAFQPHRYTRTRDCFEDFVQVLRLADVVWLTEVYAAGEEPIVAADGRALAHALRVAGQQALVFAQDLTQLEALLRQHTQDGDVVMCMGAGTIGQLPARIAGNSPAQGPTLKVVRP